MVSNIENKIDNILLYLQDMTKEINYLQRNYNKPIGIKNREYFREILYGDYFEVYKNILELIRITNDYSLNSEELRKDLGNLIYQLNHFDEIFLE